MPYYRLDMEPMAHATKADETKVVVGLTVADLEDARNLPPVLPFEVATKTLGYGRSGAYAAVRAGTFPVPILGGPGKWSCPTLALLKLLGVYE
jgi:hypothetical protein